MFHDRFTIKIDLFKYKRFKDGGCAYKNTGSSHLNKGPRSAKLEQLRKKVIVDLAANISCYLMSGIFLLANLPLNKEI